MATKRKFKKRKKEAGRIDASRSQCVSRKTK